MDDKEKMSLMLYDIILSIKDTVSLPTHSTLERTCFYSALLFVCSLLSNLLGFYTFVSWQGALFTTILLLILLLMERGENNAISRMYRSAKLSAQKTMRGGKNAGSGSGSRGNSTNANKRSNAARK